MRLTLTTIDIGHKNDLFDHGIRIDSVKLRLAYLGHLHWYRSTVLVPPIGIVSHVIGDVHLGQDQFLTRRFICERLTLDQMYQSWPVRVYSTIRNRTYASYGFLPLSSRQ